MNSEMKEMDAFSNLPDTVSAEAITVKQLKMMEPQKRNALLARASSTGRNASCLHCGKQFKRGEFYVEDTTDAGCSTCIECTDEALTIDWKQIVVRKAD